MVRVIDTPILYERVIGIVSNPISILVVSPISTIFVVLHKSIIKIKIIVLPWQH
jgi:hypothetical protein